MVEYNKPNLEALRGNTTKEVNLEEQVDEVAGELEQLKALYDRFFNGIERVPPESMRVRVEQTIRRLKGTQSNNTNIKFRISSLHNKLLTYKRLWDRSIKEIEEGRFRRDRFRIKLLEKNQDGPNPTAAPGTAASLTPTPNVPNVAAKTNPQIEALHQQFLAARQQCNENTQGLTYESFAKTLITQSQTIKQRFNCQKVSFKVVIENGKTKLKAVPK